MPPRTVQKVTLNKSEIHSGDFLGIIRMDGLDVMEAFGMVRHSFKITLLWLAVFSLAVNIFRAHTQDTLQRVCG